MGEEWVIWVREIMRYERERELKKKKKEGGGESVGKRRERE